jgi:hypothetical protein
MYRFQTIATYMYRPHVTDADYSALWSNGTYRCTVSFQTIATYMYRPHVTDADYSAHVCPLSSPRCGHVYSDTRIC